MRASVKHDTQHGALNLCHATLPASHVAAQAGPACGGERGIHITAQRQLNLRDDEIYALANDLAAQLDLPAKEVVRLALRALQRASPAAEPDRQRVLARAELDSMTQQMAGLMQAGSHTTDDARLYGDDGLPA